MCSPTRSRSAVLKARRGDTAMLFALGPRAQRRAGPVALARRPCRRAASALESSAQISPSNHRRAPHDIRPSSACCSMPSSSSRQGSSGSSSWSSRRAMRAGRSPAGVSSSGGALPVDGRTAHGPPRRLPRRGSRRGPSISAWLGWPALVATLAVAGAALLVHRHARTRSGTLGSSSFPVPAWSPAVRTGSCGTRTTSWWCWRDRASARPHRVDHRGRASPC